VWIVSPPGYVHSRCFDEVALALREGLEALGVRTGIARRPGDVAGAPIVLGGHLLGPDETPPDGAIVFNLEQIESGSGLVSPHYLALLRRHRVLDYSTLNVAALGRLGVAATLCPIGYSPALERFAPAAEQDIDVLFVGSTCERRLSVLSALHRRGARVARVFGLYGRERDQYVARARIVLNLHFYPTAIFEIVRVSYLLANRVCVVSETGPDQAMEAPLADGVAFAAYDRLVETCERLLADAAERARLAAAGYAAIRRMPQREALARALG
jgi:hypothetical protein